MEKGLMVFRIVDEAQEPKEQESAAKFRIVEETPEEPKQSQAEKIAKEFKLFGYQPSPETIEKIRHPAGVGLKGLASGILGTPGDLISFTQKMAGVKEPLKILPTSENVGSFFEKLAGEEFKPENLSEEFIERGSEFLGGILGLGGPLKGTTAAKSIGKTLLGAFAPAGVSLFTEKAELPAWSQVAATVGTGFLTHRLTGTSLKDMNKELYQRSRALAGDTKVSAKPLAQAAEKLTESLKKGGIATSDRPALTKLRQIQQASKPGEIGVTELMDFKRKINEARGMLFARDLGKPGVASARRNLNAVSKIVDKGLKTFKNNEFQEAFRDANQLYSGMKETARMANWMKQHRLFTGTGGALLKYLFPSVGLKAGVGIGATLQAGQFVKTLAKNPAYRKAYWNVLKNAAKEDIRGTATAVKRFNKETEKYKVVKEPLEE